MNNGSEYVHFGLEQGIIAELEHKSLCYNLNGKLDLQFNIDGLPLYKSSSSSLWPIMCKIANSQEFDPFTVGCYCGVQKPEDLEAYLSDFVAELLQLLQDECYE